MHAIILCNGRKPPLELISHELNRSDLFIAADGGANHAEELGLTPDLIVGDLDSYRPAYPPESVEVILKPDQESNDLEKALWSALDRGVTTVSIYGATGIRIDQTLKNLSVLKQFHPRFEHIRFVDRHGELFLLPKQYHTELPLGTSVSLIPLSGRVEGVTTSGLQYPLNKEPLEIGVRDGSSNRTLEPIVRIEHKNGDLLLFISTKPPVS
ncbi:MAG: thiamine diphosphokinase [Balneolaceae bacterium]